MSDILYKLEDGIATVTINRPQALNAFSGDMLEELYDILVKAENDKDVLVVVINSSCPKAFSVGGDIKKEIDMDGYTSFDFSMKGQAVTRQIRNMRMPVISAVNGYALGAGMEIMLASDFVFVSTDAKVSLPSINLGSTNGFGGTQLLPRIIGVMKAKEILMTGRHVKGDEAVELGLALKCVDKEELMDTAYAFAKELASKAPFALRCFKTAANVAIETDIETGYLIEAHLLARAQASDDKKEAMMAFIEKRTPGKFINR